MPAWTRAFLAVVLVVLVAAPVSASAGTPPMIRKINKARQAHGLPALRYSPSLGRSSRRFARHLMRTNSFGHARHIRASRRFHRLGECLGRQSGFRLRRSMMVRGWLGSPSHRAILLSREFNRVGASPARGRFGGQRSTIWVAQFGRAGN
jgi:uncharacterized protein YkwD